MWKGQGENTRRKEGSFALNQMERGSREPTHPEPGVWLQEPCESSEKAGQTSLSDSQSFSWLRAKTDADKADWGTRGGAERRLTSKGHIRPVAARHGHREQEARARTRHFPRGLAFADFSPGRKAVVREAGVSSWNCAQDRLDALRRGEGESGSRPGARAVPGGGGAEGRSQIPGQ